jgi:hypothetical protein
LPQRQQIKKYALSRPQDHRRSFSTWSRSKLAEFVLAEGVVDDISHCGAAAALKRAAGPRHALDNRERERERLWQPAGAGRMIKGELMRNQVWRAAVVALMAVGGLAIDLPTVSAAHFSFPLVTTTTGSCPAGRTCLNRKTVNSCGGSSNSCGVYNAGGGSADYAEGPANAHTNEERGFNNNSGTQRRVCVFNNDQSNTSLIYYGAGWTPLPFTGASYIVAIPSSGTCEPNP